MPTYPETPHVDVTEILHGEPIADPYRWLEDGENPETRRWTEQQNAVTEAYLAAVPGRDTIRRRLERAAGYRRTQRAHAEARAGTSISAARDGRTSRCSTGGMGVDGADRVAVDPNALE